MTTKKGAAHGLIVRATNNERDPIHSLPPGDTADHRHADGDQGCVLRVVCCGVYGVCCVVLLCGEDEEDQ
jgi:hypothetical protein